MTDIQKLLDIMRTLRDPEQGCPWDKQQSFQTIAPYTIEEAYEVAEAIERDDMEELCSELGDLLLQVVYHSQLAREAGHFNFDQVVQGINKKLLDRHPHVFGNAEYREPIDTAEAQSERWENIKSQERKAKATGNFLSILADIGLNMPALSRAQKLQKRAARVGFDWSYVQAVFAKINEEINEIQEVLEKRKNSEKLSEEIGDLLFACVNLARHNDVDAEFALRKANKKFETRFQYIEKCLLEQNKMIEEVSLQEMDELWNEAKTYECEV